MLTGLEPTEAPPTEYIPERDGEEEGSNRGTFTDNVWWKEKWPFKATGGMRRRLHSTLEWSVKAQHAPGSVY